MAWTKEEHECAKGESARGLALTRLETEAALAEIDRTWAEIEQLKKALKASNDRADYAEGRLRHYEGHGRAYAD